MHTNIHINDNSNQHKNYHTDQNASIHKSINENLDIHFATSDTTGISTSDTTGIRTSYIYYRRNIDPDSSCGHVMQHDEVMQVIELALAKDLLTGIEFSELEALTSKLFCAKLRRENQCIQCPCCADYDLNGDGQELGSLWINSPTYIDTKSTTNALEYTL